MMYAFMDIDPHIVDKLFAAGKLMLQHPFFIMIGGIYLWFILKWSWMKNAGQINTWKEFKADQKDEFAVTMSFGFAFLIWDDEFIGAYQFLMAWWNNTLTPEWTPTHVELMPFMYLMVGLAVERLYVLKKFIIRKRNGGKG